MDNEMIERVAKTISDNTNVNVRIATLIAPKIIKTMREPTQEMLAFRIMSDAEKDSLKADYQAMIDHIIGE